MELLIEMSVAGSKVLVTHSSSVRSFELVS
jgi:hypothetical protein